MRRAAVQPFPACANCSADLCLDGPEAPPVSFCPHCGQHNTSLDTPFFQLVWEAAQDALQLDSQTWRTLRTLLLKPGELTRAFNAGHRVAFLPPLRLYGWVTLVFFLALNLKVNHNLDDRTVAQLMLIQPYRFAYNSRPSSFYGPNTPQLTRTDLTHPALLQRLARGEASATDSLLRRSGSPATWLHRRLVRGMAVKALQRAGEVREKALNVTTATLFALMPLAALLLLVAFRRPTQPYIRHLICAIHLHTAFFLLLTPLVLLPDMQSQWINQLLALSLFTYVIAYSLLSLRRVYGLSWAATSWRGVAVAVTYLGVVYTVIGSLFVLGEVVY